MSPRFPVKLRTERIAKRYFRLLAPFVFLSPTLGRITVEEGFDTDFASIPRALWSLYPPDGDYTDAAVIHDWAYWYQPYTREQCDRLFLEAMQALGIPWLRRHVLHTSVRAGGWLAWRDNRQKRAAEEALAPSVPHSLTPSP